MQLLAPRYEMTPMQTKLLRIYQSIRYKDKAYQDSRDHHKVMTSPIMWPHTRLTTLKVTKCHKIHKHKHFNQVVKFAPKRTWPLQNDDVTTTHDIWTPIIGIIEGNIWFTIGVTYHDDKRCWNKGIFVKIGFCWQENYLALLLKILYCVGSDLKAFNADHRLHTLNLIQPNMETLPKIVDRLSLKNWFS